MFPWTNPVSLFTAIRDRINTVMMKPRRRRPKDKFCWIPKKVKRQYSRNVLFLSMLKLQAGKLLQYLVPYYIQFPLINITIVEYQPNSLSKAANIIYNLTIDCWHKFIIKYYFKCHQSIFLYDVNNFNITCNNVCSFYKNSKINNSLKFRHNIW